MVQRTMVILEDDIDGGDATQTVEFGLDGVTYEIDLNDENATKLRDALAVWVGHARKAAPRAARRTVAPARSGSRRRSEGAEIRAWALSQGYKVSARGRVPEEIRAAYLAAH